MGIWGESKTEKEEFRIIEDLVQENRELVRVINRIFPSDNHGQNVKLVFTTSINNFKITFMALSLNQGSFSLDQLALIDTDTSAPVQATFANIQAFSSDNTAVLTTAPDPSSPSDPSKCLNTAVSGGTANVLGQADVTYTDGKTNQPVTKTLKLSIPYTVLATVAGENVALTLIQGTPGITPVATS